MLTFKGAHTALMQNGQVQMEPRHIMYKGTQVMTGELSVLIYLVNDIPQIINVELKLGEIVETLEVTVHYRQQPKHCFVCGEKVNCPHRQQNAKTRSQKTAYTDSA